MGRVTALAWAMWLLPCSALAQPDVGAAEPPTATLSWVRLTGADTCLSTQELARSVESLLDRRVWISAPRAQLTVEGWVEPAAAGSGFAATILVSNADGAILGRREVRTASDHCAALAEPLALVIAVTIDPGHDVSEEEVDDGHAQAVPPIAAVAADDGSARAPVPVRAPRPERAWRLRLPPEGPATDDAAAARLRLSAGIVAGVGRGPGVTAGLSVGVRDFPATFPLLIQAAFWLPPSAQSAASGSARIWRGELLAEICPLRPRGSRVSAWLCGGLQAGLVRIDPEGFRRNHGQTRLELDPVLSARGAVAVGEHVGLGLSLTVGVPFPRLGLQYVDEAGETRTLYDTPPVRGLLAAELLWAP